MAGLKALWVATQTLMAAIAAGGPRPCSSSWSSAWWRWCGFRVRYFLCRRTHGGRCKRCAGHYGLNEEYQERLQEIEGEEEYDRQEIESNDGSYAIAWQDVLAVFAARTSGAEDGAPVAYLDEENLERLRSTLWDMNEVDNRTETQRHEVDVPDEDGNVATETVSETVLVIELTHRSPEEMRDEYGFNARQNEYLTLFTGRGYHRAVGRPARRPCHGRAGRRDLGAWLRHHAGRWCPAMAAAVAGTITSPQGYRTDPITGEISYHSGTDITVPEGTPILAAADGTVTVANALDSWGRQLRLPRQARPRRRADDAVRALLQHLRHGGANRSKPGRSSPTSATPAAQRGRICILRYTRSSCIPIRITGIATNALGLSKNSSAQAQI